MRQGEYQDADGKRYSAAGYLLCSAKKRNGKELCDSFAMRDRTVCVNHGGRAPQVRRKANVRRAFLDAGEETAAFLIQQMRDDTLTARDRQAAANSILDRAGVGRVNQLEVGDAEDYLLDKLIEAAQQQYIVEERPDD